MKKWLGWAAVTAVLLTCGAGCQLFCDGYCDRRDRDCDRRRDPCRSAPPGFSDCR